MSDAGLRKLDRRGLMPLARARQIVAEAQAEPRVLWAALLSLRDGEEFVEAMRSIRPSFHARGPANAAPFERYGTAVLPWIADLLQRGTLRNVPDAALASLMRIGTRTAFDLVWRTRRVNDGRSVVGAGPFAAGKEGRAQRAPAREVGDALVIEWVERHPAIGLRELVRRRDRRARRIRELFAARWPDRIAPEDGKKSILALLDGFAAGRIPTEGAPWPTLERGDPEDRCHALRLFAARKGKRWGIAFERVTGSQPENARVIRFLYGSNVAQPGEKLMPQKKLHLFVEGAELVGPCGSIRAPQRARYSTLIGAYLARHPDAFFSDAAELLGELGLAGGRIVADLHSFDHAMTPSASPTYRTLAAKLA
jgi:hypothetical protein